MAKVTVFDEASRRRIGDAVRKVEQMAAKRPGVAVPLFQRTLDRDCVWIDNQTGYDLRAGDAAILGAPSRTAEVDRDLRYFSSPSPITSNYYKPWGVVTNAVKSGEAEQLQVSGAAVCYATISDSIERPFLAPGASGKLKPSWWGSAEIVYADIATNGERYVLARLGVLQTPIYKAITESTIAPNGSGPVGLRYSGAKQETVTAYLNHMEGTTSIKNGADVLIRWFPDEAKWVIINADCG